MTTIVTPDQLRSQARTSRGDRRFLYRVAKLRKAQPSPESIEAAEAEAIRSQIVPVEIVGCAKRAERFGAA